jgi:hypothetical protein
MADWHQNYGATGAPLADRQSGDRRNHRGRSGHARFPRRIRSIDRQGSVALLDRPEGRRPGFGDMAGQRHRARRRAHLDHRHLRSAARHALLADRQSGEGIQRRRSQRRRPLYRLPAGPRSEDRQAEMVLPVHAARHCSTGMPRKFPYWWTPIFRASRASWYFMPTGTVFSTCFDRTNGKLLLAKQFLKELTWASGIGADGRPVMNAESGADRGRHARLPVAGWRDEFLFAFVYSGHRVCSTSRRLRSAAFIRSATWRRLGGRDRIIWAACSA